MTSALVCVSHSPIIMIRAKAPPEEAAIQDYYQTTVEAIARFDPGLVIVFGSDHFAGFFDSLMPAYCIGTKATAVDDVGGFPGDLDVPEELATELLEHLRERGFDPALSRQMKIDHGFSQPLYRLLGGLDARQVIPIFIGAMCEPPVRFQRSRLFGEAVGQFIALRDRRVLLIGSGGLSHHPARYYPMRSDADPDVQRWQLDGEGGGSMTERRWLNRLRTMHEEGALMLVDGRRTEKDIRLNAEFDSWFMNKITAGDHAALDALDPKEIIRWAGIGSMELHTWIAASNAHLALGGALPNRALYVPALEYGIGYGMMTAGLTDDGR